VCRGDIEAELFHQPGQARGLTLRQLEDEPGERGGVDDRVLERALQAAAHEPRVEGVVTVLHQDGALRKAQERPPRVPELGRADEHRAFDVVAATRIWIDGSPAVDERVEEGELTREGEPLGSDLQHQERGVAGRLHVQRHELGVFQSRARADLGRVHGNLLPRHRLDGTSGFEKYRFRGHVTTNATLRGPAPSGQTRSRPR